MLSLSLGNGNFISGRSIYTEHTRGPSAVQSQRRKDQEEKKTTSLSVFLFFFYEPNRMMKGPPTYIRTKSILCNFFSLSKIDEDECATANGGCDGTCTNRPGSFTCLCPVGFRMASNSKKCICVIWPLL